MTELKQTRKIANNKREKQLLFIMKKIYNLQMKQQKRTDQFGFRQSK